MIEELYQNILSEIDLRHSLIELKEALKKDRLEAQKRSMSISIAACRLKNLTNGDYSVFAKLLYNSDAKVRKNSAAIIGYLYEPELIAELFKAYNAEEQLFVRSAYLSAIQEYDYKRLLPSLKKVYDELKNSEIKEDEEKHRNEELKLLSEMIRKAEGTQLHIFTGAGISKGAQRDNGANTSKTAQQDNQAQASVVVRHDNTCGQNTLNYNIVLLTNRNFKELTVKRVKPYAEQVTEFNAGIRFKTRSLESILPIRTYEEIFFVIEDLKACSDEPLQAAKMVAESGLLDFLMQTHKSNTEEGSAKYIATEGSSPFYFRIEMKSDMEFREKTIFTRKMAAEIEKLSGRKLLNSTQQYEIELRLIQNKKSQKSDEAYNVLVKLYTLKDMRFFYRKESVSYDIKPVNAALTMELAADYLIEGGQVLDPFCGSGVMLVERKRRKPAGTLYGLDSHKDAIQKAQLNTQIARVMVNLINRNFDSFKHEYLFDEIVTNMPSSKNSSADIDLLYRSFFAKADKHLKEKGVMVLYSHDRELISKYACRKFKIEKEFEISVKEEAYVYILKLR